MLSTFTLYNSQSVNISCSMRYIYFPVTCIGTLRIENKNNNDDDYNNVTMLSIGFTNKFFYLFYTDQRMGDKS